MTTKTFTLTVEEIDSRIAQATRALSRKKFTEKQLRQYIVNGKIHSESKRTKSGYQLFLDDFRKDLSKEERSNVGQVAKDGAAQWREMDDEAKQPYLDHSEQIKKEVQDSPDDSDDESKKKTKKKETPKAKKETSKAKKETPKAKKETSKAKKETPKAKKETPKAKKETPKDKKIAKKDSKDSKDSSKSKKEKEEIDWDSWGDIDDIEFTRFVCEDDKSSKFWEFKLNDDKILVRYGKIGSEGTIQQKTFDSDKDASKYIVKETSAKEKKGYIMD